MKAPSGWGLEFYGNGQDNNLIINLLRKYLELLGLLLNSLSLKGCLIMD
jgi:hypothetical protein